MLRFHTQTGGVTLTAQQPDNNVVRVTLQALAAVLGGTQSLHTNSKDEALRLPAEESVRLALRTQQVIAHESGVVEHGRSTGRELLRRAPDRYDRGRGRNAHQDRSTRMGGMVAAIDERLRAPTHRSGRLRVVHRRSNGRSGSSSESTTIPTTSR